MGLSGNWLASTLGPETSYGADPKWGTGIDPVHATRDGGYGRGTALGTPGGVPPADITNSDDDEMSGWCAEDTPEAVDWGYGPQTGTSDRPPVGTPNIRAASHGFPSWGRYPAGRPGGSVIRAEDHGSADQTVIKAQLRDDAAAQGWENKRVGDVNDSVVSDPSTVYMQTSATQRDKTRAGSQRGGGSASDFVAPIQSRIVGVKLKFFGDSPERHSAMFPRQQNLILRPFWGRMAGTANPALLEPNAMYSSEPIVRSVPPDPYQGDQSIDLGAGWTSEDMY